MTFDDAMRLISGFWNGKVPFAGSNSSEALRVEEEFGRPLPTQLRQYLVEYAPAPSFAFSSVGNPVELYESKQVSHRALGYNFNPVTCKIIEGWSNSWVLIADEGADPIIVDLDEGSGDGAFPVFQAMHGVGAWEFSKIADSLPQFLVLLSARHHALKGFGPEDPIVDDENGFCLAPGPSAWLFPFVQKHAPEYYGEWLSVFENS